MAADNSCDFLALAWFALWRHFFAAAFGKISAGMAMLAARTIAGIRLVFFANYGKCVGARHASHLMSNPYNYFTDTDSGRNDDRTYAYHSRHTVAGLFFASGVLIARGPQVGYFFGQ